MREILIGVFTLLSTTLLAQNQEFNVPPGSKLKSKTNTTLDYSHKLHEMPMEAPAGFTADDFFKHFDKQELREQEESSPELKSYYDNARTYYRSLADKVKYTYTVEELWYIFQYDAALRQQLLQIK